MGRIISIVNQKGGVGKTTTAVNLAACLAEKNKKVLLIDFDPQGNTTSGFGIDKNNIEGSIYDVIIDNIGFDEAIVKTDKKKLFIIPSNINLSGAEIELITAENREYILKKFLDTHKNNFDFIIIDCPPSLNILTLNALAATDTILVPLQCEYYALEGLSQLLKTIDLVKENINPNLVVEGVVFTMFDSRTNLSNQVMEEVKNYLDKSIYVSVIPRTVRLSEAPSHGLAIIDYEPKGKGSLAYRELAKQVIRR